MYELETMIEAAATNACPQPLGACEQAASWRPRCLRSARAGSAAVALGICIASLLWGTASLVADVEEPTVKPLLLREWRFDRDGAGWIAQRDCRRTVIDGMLSVECTGDNAALVEHVSAAPGLMKLSLRMRVESEHPGRGQLFWVTSSHPRPSTARSTVFSVFRGFQWHDYALWIRPDEAISALWFAPMNTPARVDIERMALERAEFPAAQATPVSDIELLPGFRAELLYSVPKEEHGSWVCMAFDPRGRLVASDQYGSLYRITLPRGDRAIEVERLDVDIGQCQGMLFAYDSLYVTVNGVAAQSRGFYRLQDTSGDDQFDKVELLKSFTPVPRDHSDHGPHAIALGPDGMLYVLGGNNCAIPTDSTPTSPHRNWREDLLIPRHTDPNGHNTRCLAPGGWVFRTDRDARVWEFVAGGFRNPYDIAFNERGDLFTFDSDMEWDVGCPWYRPTRVNMVSSGAEYGWRNGAGKWPPYFPDSLPAIIDIGLGCPTGVTTGVGARFPAKYQRALFVNDWTYGKMYAVHLVPTGSAYTATFETFVSGKPLPLTDVAVGPDGALYFLIGGRRLQSGLYRVTYFGRDPPQRALATEGAAKVDGTAIDGKATTTDEVATKKVAAARRLRRRLEAYHGRHNANAVNEAWEHLNSDDPFLRSAARIAIEHQPVSTWRERALAEMRPTAAIQALVALARNGSPEVQGRLIKQLSALPIERLTEEQALGILRAYALAFSRLGPPDDATAAEVVGRLDPLYPSPSDLLNRELCRVLTYLQAPTVVPKTMALLERAATQEDQMYFVYALSSAREGWTLPLQRKYFSWFHVATAKYTGGVSFQGYVKSIQKAAEAHLSDASRAALKDVLEGEVTLSVVSSDVSRRYVHNWQMADIVPALADVSHGRSFEKGKAAFEATRCLACHRLNGQGGATGPDLTTVGNRFSDRDVLESILHPSKVIADQYRPTQFVLNDGSVLVGNVEEESDESLVLRAHPLAPESRRFKKSSVVTRQPAALSLMPAGLVSILTKDEVLDLVAYVRAGGNPKAAAFQPRPSQGKGQSSDPPRQKSADSGTP